MSGTINGAPEAFYDNSFVDRVPKSGLHNGLWYPVIKIYSESDGPHGAAQQRFIVHDGLPSNRFE